MRIEPLGTRVLVGLNAVEERKTDAGLWLPDKHSEQSRLGTVLCIGPEVRKVSVGDRVILSFAVGSGIDYPGLEGFHYDKHRIMDQDEIWGRVFE